MNQPIPVTKQALRFLADTTLPRGAETIELVSLHVGLTTSARLFAL